MNVTMDFVLEQDQSPEFSNELLLLFSEPLIDPSGQPFSDRYPELQIEDEIEILRKAAAHSSARFQLNIEPAIPDRIRYTFSRSFRPLILHFIGYGIPFETDKTALVSEDAVGRANYISGSALLGLVGRSPPPCELAVLNCCHSVEFARVLIRAGVIHVVAVHARGRLLRAACHAFAKHFYPPIFQGQEIQSAFELARAAVYEDDQVRFLLRGDSKECAALEEVLTFGLYPEDSLDHREPLSVEADSGVEGSLDDVIVLEEAYTNLCGNIPCVGRQVDIHEVLKLVQTAPSQKLVGLHGMGGMGKTSLAINIGRWYYTRRIDGIWYCDLRLTTKSSKAWEKIRNVLGLGGHVALLILDDLDALIDGDEEGLCAMLHALQSAQFRVLATSRRALPSRIDYWPFEIARLSYTAALAMFEEFAPPRGKWGDSKDANEHLDAILKILDGYPFPIRLAATYMRQTRCSLAGLRQSLEEDTLQTLAIPEESETRDTSLRRALDVSFRGLPTHAKDMFRCLTIFPAGLTRHAAQMILSPKATKSIYTLTQFSMAESVFGRGEERWRLPEPARIYAADLPGPTIDDLAATYGIRALIFYDDFIRKRVALALSNDAKVAEEAAKAAAELFREQLNIDSFVRWGIQHESKKDGQCYSARITAMLVDYLLARHSGDLRELIELSENGIIAAQRLQDKYAEALLRWRIADVHLFCREKEAALKEANKVEIRGHEDAALTALKAAETLLFCPRK